MTVVSSWGCLTLRDERRSEDRLITAREGSPPRPCPQPCAPPTLCPAAPPHRFWLRWWSALDQTRAGCARRAIAHMKPTISRAIAVVTTTFGLPVAAMRRYRAHKRRDRKSAG